MTRRPLCFRCACLRTLSSLGERLLFCVKRGERWRQEGGDLLKSEDVHLDAVFQHIHARCSDSGEDVDRQDCVVLHEVEE